MAWRCEAHEAISEHVEALVGVGRADRHREVDPPRSMVAYGTKGRDSGDPCGDTVIDHDDVPAVEQGKWTIAPVARYTSIDFSTNSVDRGVQPASVKPYVAGVFVEHWRVEALDYRADAELALVWCADLVGHEHVQRGADRLGDCCSYGYPSSGQGEHDRLAQHLGSQTPTELLTSVDSVLERHRVSPVRCGLSLTNWPRPHDGGSRGQIELDLGNI